jgi:hypothetical protein
MDSPTVACPACASASPAFWSSCLHHAQGLIDVIDYVLAVLATNTEADETFRYRVTVPARSALRSGVYPPKLVVSITSLHASRNFSARARLGNTKLITDP